MIQPNPLANSRHSGADFVAYRKTNKPQHRGLKTSPHRRIGGLEPSFVQPHGEKSANRIENQEERKCQVQGLEKIELSLDSACSRQGGGQDKNKRRVPHDSVCGIARPWLQNCDEQNDRCEGNQPDPPRQERTLRSCIASHLSTVSTGRGFSCA